MLLENDAVGVVEADAPTVPVEVAEMDLVAEYDTVEDVDALLP